MGRRELRRTWVAGAVLASTVSAVGIAAPVAAQTPSVTQVATGVTAFVGVAGAPNQSFFGPGYPFDNVDQFTEAFPSAAPELKNSVMSYFTTGGQRMSVYPSASNAAGDLSAAIETTTIPVNNSLPANLLVVPALGGLNGEDYYSVAVKLNSAAATVSGMSLLDLPQQVVQAANTTGDVSGAMLVGETLINRLPSPATAALYTSSLIDPVAHTAVSGAGVAAGLFNTSDTRFGVWADPAGDALPLEGYVPQWFPGAAAGGDMEAIGLNSFRVSAATGLPELWGARTLATRDQSTRYIAAVRTAQNISNSLNEGLLWTRFETDGPSLLKQVNGAVDTWMSGLAADGAFGHWSSMPGYVVVANESNNSVADIAAGRVNVAVAYQSSAQPEYFGVHVTARAAPGI